MRIVFFCDVGFLISGAIAWSDGASGLTSTQDLQPTRCDFVTLNECPSQLLPWSVGDEIPCWQLNVEVWSKTEITAVYNCKNTDCIKMVSPAKEISDYDNASRASIEKRITHVGIGLACLLIACYIKFVKMG